jgi:hypothetical protein
MPVNAFLTALHNQRWDDHRYYHHSRINQSLHLLSAMGFLVAYALLFTDPAAAALVAWLWSMVSRQAGHFFFEPKGFDAVNQVTHEYKEEIKVGYNLQRKVVLMGLWAAAPLLVWWDPTVAGLLTAPDTAWGFARNVGWVWLYIGLGAMLMRVLQLYWQQDLYTGMVWATKIITDPFHDIKLYHKAPLYLMRGQLLDPGHRAG